MKNYGNIIKLGLITLGIAWVLFCYDFFTMYSIVGKCPLSGGTCRAYDTWKLHNQVALVVLIIGIVLLVVGLVRQHRKKI